MPPSGSFFGGPFKRVNGSTSLAGSLMVEGGLFQPNSPATRLPNRMSYVGALPGWYVTNDGTVTELGGFGLSDFIPVPVSSLGRMLIANDLNEYLTAPGCYYDANRQYISSIFSSAVYEGGQVFVVPPAAAFVRIVYRIDVPLYLGFSGDLSASPVVLSVLGDSIMTKFGSNTTSIPEVMRARMGIGAVQNLAEGGLRIATSNGIASRCAQVSEFSTHVLLEGGVNDWGGSIPIGTIADSTLDTFYGACNYIADFFQNRRPYQKLVWMTPFRSGISIANPSTLADYAAAVRAVGLARGIRVVDAYSEFPLNFETTLGGRLYSWDQLHANDIGNSIIADFCINAVFHP